MRKPNDANTPSSLPGLFVFLPSLEHLPFILCFHETKQTSLTAARHRVLVPQMSWRITIKKPPKQGWGGASLSAKIMNINARQRELGGNFSGCTN